MHLETDMAAYACILYSVINTSTAKIGNESNIPVYIPDFLLHISSFCGGLHGTQYNIFYSFATEAM